MMPQRWCTAWLVYRIYYFVCVYIYIYIYIVERARAMEEIAGLAGNLNDGRGHQPRGSSTVKNTVPCIRLSIIIIIFNKTPHLLWHQIFHVIYIFFTV
jgi:hypothetical protein